MLAFAAVAAGAGVDITATEGQSFTKKVADITGCSFSSASVSWGDGTAASGGSSDGGTGVQGTHTYADEGTFNGTVSYTCTNLSGAHQASFQATVQDAALTAAGRNVSGTATQPLTATVAHVQDTNPGASAGDFSAQIAWGDGSTSPGSVAAAGGGGFDVSGTHTYATAGSFGITTSITDAGGSTASATSAAQIAAPPPPPPRSTGPPVVSGEARQQEPLTSTPGDWSGSPTSFQYQWVRCDSAGGNCVGVPGATASTYIPVHADVGSTLRARVRATNTVGTSLPADSASTPVVAPLVVRARFTISPNPTCAGLTTSLDASVSKTPHPPIVRYRFTWSISQFNADGVLPFGEAYTNPRTGVEFDVADGHDPRAIFVPPWTDLLINTGVQTSNVNILVVSPMIVTLTVTDSAGARDSYSQHLEFAQVVSSQTRSVCPGSNHRGRRDRFGSHSLSNLKVTKSHVRARIPCVSLADCSGALQVYSRARRHGKPIVIARNDFFIVPGGHTATITAKLTRAGRALAKHAKPTAAIARLITFGPTGQRTIQSRPFTLRVH
jgi:hypothetical protein